MKALTLYRPWPWAIFHASQNPKRIENRPWKPWPSIINKPIVLHAGKTFDSDAADELCAMFGLHPDGAVPHGWKDAGLIGVVTVRGVAASSAECEQFMADQSEWFSGPFAWLLSDVRPFPKPIPCAGSLGLWDVPVELLPLVDEALR